MLSLANGTVDGYLSRVLINVPGLLESTQLFFPEKVLNLRTSMVFKRGLC